MKTTLLEIADLVKIEPEVHGDDRGFFFESWNQTNFEQHGINVRFVQDAFSRSARGVLRGLHYQNPYAQGKLVSVLEGEIFDVAVDLRTSSKTFGKWVSLKLSDKNHWQFYIPPGFAHGFQVVSEHALISYKMTEFYKPGADASLLWSDSELNIPWPIKNPSLSAKDLEGLALKDISRSKLYP